MSAPVHVDPVKLRQFGEELGRTLNAYSSALETLSVRLARLGSTWQDQEFAAFSREVTTTKRIIEEFIREGQAARANLLRDAEAAEAYQRTRPT